MGSTVIHRNIRLSVVMRSNLHQSHLRQSGCIVVTILEKLAATGDSNSCNCLVLCIEILTQMFLLVPYSIPPEVVFASFPPQHVEFFAPKVVDSTAQSEAVVIQLQKGRLQGCYRRSVWWLRAVHGLSEAPQCYVHRYPPFRSISEIQDSTGCLDTRQTCGCRVTKRWGQNR